MDNLTAGNPKAHRIRVYYSGSSDIAEGMPVCYSFDSTANWWGGSVSDEGVITEATTVTEGALNPIRYIQVEDPDADNQHAFAGIVAKGGWCGKTDPCMMDIYVPNGAVVPVLADQACVMGRTILAVNPSELFLTAPLDDARPVAIAWETNAALSDSAGLILAKLDPNMFLYQKGDNNSLLIDDLDTGGKTVNMIRVTSSAASGDYSALVIASDTATISGHSGIYTRVTNTGTGAGGFNTIQARSNAEGTAIASSVYGIYSQVDLKAASGLTSTGFAAGIFSKVHIKTSGGTYASGCNVVAGRFSLGLDTAVAGRTAMFYFEHQTTVAETPDYFFITASGTDSTESIGFAANSTGAGAGTKLGCIKIYLGNAADEGFIPVYDTVGGG